VIVALQFTQIHAHGPKRCARNVIHQQQLGNPIIPEIRGIAISHRFEPTLAPSADENFFRSLSGNSLN